MIKKQLFFLIFTCCIIYSAGAQTFTVNNIKYDVTDTVNKTVAVGDNGFDLTLTGVITIPETVVNNGITYTVTSFSTHFDGFAFDWGSFTGCTNITSVVIPNTITTIKESAFASCTSLTSVTIPTSITSIESAAFSNSGLTSITIPNSVTSLGTRVFEGCTNLQSAVVPNSIISIPASAFFNCTSLTTVSSKSPSLASIGSSAFQSCSSLTSLMLSTTTPPSLGFDAFSGVTLGNLDLSIESATTCPSPNPYSTATTWQDFKSISCTSPPVVVTNDATNVTNDQGVLTGNVTSDGGATVVERGILFSQTSINSNPKIGDTNLTGSISITNPTYAFSYAPDFLPSNTEYSFVVYARNSVGVGYGEVKTFITNVAPVFQNSTPSSENITTTGFTLNTDIDEAGTIYYVVVADGATAPTSAEVKAGTGSGGSGQVTSGNASVTTGAFTNAFNVTGLTLNTAYDVYVVAEDDESSPILQVSPTKVDVTTNKALSVTITVNKPSSASAFDGSLTMNPVGGTPPYSYLWNDNSSQTTATATGLAAGSYTYWVTDNAGTTITSSVTLTPVDTTPPAFENSTPNASSIVQTSFTLNTDIDEGGTIYYVVVADGATAPTSAEVKAGTGSGGSGQVTSGNTTVSTGDFSNAFNVTGLTGNTAYDVYVLAEDDEGTPNLQASPTKIDITTANTPPTFTSTAITTVDEGDTYTYTIATNDVDGDNVALTAPTKPSWLSLIRNITGGNVTTFAGTGSAGNTDANGSAASFNNPIGVAVDGSGNVYVADTHNHIIRKVAPNGDVTTFAGTGSAGSTDANGTSASFNFPYGVALDGSGNLYVADGENNKIRKITPNGDVTTLAGSGSQGDTDGNGASASFKTPFGVAVDGSGNVYVADANNRKIRKVAPNGDVTTVAGSGTAGSMDGNGTSASFVLPFGIAVDDSGNAYVADGFGNTIRKIAPNGDVTTLAGSVSFSNPFGIVVDDSGNVYVSESTSNKIRKITPNGDVTTLAGSGSQGSMDGDGASASFYSPAGIALDATGNFYVADRFNNKIRKIITIASSTLTGDSTGEAGDHNVTLEANDGNGGTVQQSFTISVNTKPTVSSSVATSITGTGATLNGNVSSDGGATITERGFVYALSSDDSTPTVAEVNGTTVVKVVVSGTTGVFNEAITGLTVNGTYSFVAYAINSVGTTESSVATFTTINTAPTFTSTAITTIDEGDAYTYTITTNDMDDDNVTLTASTKPAWLSLTTNPGGDVTTFAGTGSAGSTDGNGSAASFNFPYGAAVDGSGNIYVADESNHTIRKIAPNGDVTTFAGSGIAGSTDGNGTSASFNSPTKVAVDGSGNVYVADLSNHSIRKIAPNGDVTTIAGTGSQGSTDGNGSAASFSFPFGVAVDVSGNVYVADVGNQKIRKIAPNGDVTTLAGSGSQGSTDGNGTNASFNIPFALAVDGTGNVYVADQNNHSIRKIASNGDVTTVAGSGSSGSTDGNGTSASFNVPSGVSVDDSGNVYVADSGNHSIRKIAPNGDVTTVAGTGSAGNTEGNGTSASFNNPIGVAVGGSGNVYVVDRNNHKVRKISTASSTILTGDSTGQAGDHPVVLEANDGNGGIVQQSFTINVLPEPTVTLSVDNSSINEASGTATLTATLSNTYGKNVEVTIGYSGTALNGTDYNNTASTTITINAGSLSANASTIITPINDTSPEGDETIIAEITGVTNGTENGDQTLEITLVDDDLIPAEITFEDIAKTYGDDDFTLGATSNSTGTISYAIVAGGTGSASLSGTNNETVNVGDAGTVTIRAILPADGNYDSATKDITLTISKAILVVTANDTTIEYGDNLFIGFTYGAFKNGDDASVLDTGAYVFIVQPTPPFDAGTYTIRPDALSDNNYTPNYVDGTLIINKATLTVTADDQSKTYGDTNPSFTVSYSGFKNNEDASVLDTEPTASSTAVNNTDVGTSSITVSGGSDNNYTFSNVDGTLTINERPITITADDKTKERTTADPVFTYMTTSGDLITGDAFTGDLTRDAGEASGMYAITQGTLTAGTNYNLTFIEGTLTIEDTIAPNPPTITHVSEYTCTGDTSITGDNTLEISGTAEEGSTVEVFIETISVGTVITDNNGFFTFDHTGTTLADGTYNITAQATDIDGNTGVLSAIFTITVDSLDTDGDGLPDVCDDDYDGNGVDDIDEDCDNDGIVDHLDSDNSSCATAIQQIKSFGFSPNGDGVNDEWYIENITAYPNNIVSVYNRSGKLVFKKKGYQNDWNGVSNQISRSGRRLPVGPYLFIINLGDGSKPTRGWIYINY